MTSKRTCALLIILLMLMGMYIFKDFAENREHDFKIEPPLPGQTEILGFDIERRDSFKYYAIIDYFYTGAPKYAALTVSSVEADPGAENSKNIFEHLVARASLVRGRNTVVLEILNPRQVDTDLKITKNIAVNLVNSRNVTQTLIKEYTIEWRQPDVIAQEIYLASSTDDDLYEASVGLVDKGTRYSLSEARKRLETIIIRNPEYVPAYIELARVEMKTGWNEEGLRKAESHLNTALGIDIDSANAHVLRGYVYIYQKKFSKAQLSFETAERLGTNNLWLWANWGEMLVFQDKPDEAIIKYRKAVNAQRPFNTYDRAQLDAYVKLITILSKEDDKTELGKLYSKRMTDYVSKPCFASEYAIFLAKYKDDYLEPEKIARQALEQGCRERVGRLALGLVNYFKWHGIEKKSKEASLSQARVFYPESPALYYDLIEANEGKIILKDLLRQGENNIDSKNSENYTALSLALFAGDEKVVKSLLELQASFDLNVGGEDLPISFIPIVRNDVSMLNLLKEYGVNYRTLTYVGLTAKQFSDQIGSNDTSKELPAGGRI